MSFAEAVCFVLCFSLSLYACNGRILDPKPVTVNMVSDLQQTETGSSLKTLSTLTAGRPVASRKVIGSGYERRDANTENVEERILQEENAAAQEYDSDDSKNVVEDAVVMDYAQPHRKPPIHNKEN